MPTASRAVLVTGMHRSGTSVLAHALASAGVAMGDRLNPADAGNRYGHFEDLDFLRFHEDVLRARAIDALAPPAAWVPDPSPAELARAERLCEARGTRPLWGFKDPRTSLFLSFWRERLPGARFVLLYRHPVEVVLSLLRRGSDPEVLRSPRTGFAAWRAYNRRLLEYRAAHPDECLLLEARAAAAGLGACLALIGDRFGIPLAPNAAGAIFDADSKSRQRGVISRSGASTVSELAVIGRPAILVPYPHALDHDQAANAAVSASR